MRRPLKDKVDVVELQTISALSKGRLISSDLFGVSYGEKPPRLQTKTSVSLRRDHVVDCVALSASALETVKGTIAARMGKVLCTKGPESRTNGDTVNLGG